MVYKRSISAILYMRVFEVIKSYNNHIFFYLGETFARTTVQNRSSNMAQVGLCVPNLCCSFCFAKLQQRISTVIPLARIATPTTLSTKFLICFNDLIKTLLSDI